MTDQFIERAIGIHGDKYDYSKVEYKKSTEKIIIICSKHGDFEQTPHGHLCGRGCRKCGNEQIGLKLRSTNNEFIEKAIKIHGEKYTYDKVEYKRAIYPIIITCQKHGDFEQIPNSHLDGKGCCKCAIEKNSLACRSDTNEFIANAIKIHGDKYSYDKVDYVRSLSKIIITCPTHGDFEQSPSAHLSGRGCFTCAHESIGLASRSTTEEFIEKAKKVHGDKYNYDSLIYTTSIEYVNIVCKKHGVFKQRANQHLSGYGCYACGPAHQSTTEEFIAKAIIIHENFYNYDEVKYMAYDKDVRLKCPYHGLFFQHPIVHLSGSGCPKCARIRIRDALMSSQTTFIECAKKIHGDFYDYSKTNYDGCKNKIIIICKKHGEFKQTPFVHMRGSGCPRCKMTTGEKFIYILLQNMNINFIFQKKFDGCVDVKPLKFDFYVEQHNMVIEYDGKQHFEPIDYFGGVENFESIKRRDRIKNEFCSKNNIDMVRIPYTMSKKEITDIIKKKLE